MNLQESLDLKKLVNEMNCEDNTQHIRKVKHSILIRDDIRKLEILKKQEANMRKENPESFLEMARAECSFLFCNYTDILNKVLKDELDLDIMTQLLHVLKLIEDGKVDQHEGSVLVGKILKELYVDSAIKRGQNLDKEHEESNPNPAKIEGKPISWLEWKKRMEKGEWKRENGK